MLGNYLQLSYSQYHAVVSSYACYDVPGSKIKSFENMDSEHGRIFRLKKHIDRDWFPSENLSTRLPTQPVTHTLKYFHLLLTPSPLAGIHSTHVGSFAVSEWSLRGLILTLESGKEILRRVIVGVQGKTRPTWW